MSTIFYLRPSVYAMYVGMHRLITCILIEVIKKIVPSEGCKYILRIYRGCQWTFEADSHYIDQCIFPWRQPNLSVVYKSVNSITTLQCTLVSLVNHMHILIEVIKKIVPSEGCKYKLRTYRSCQWTFKADSHYFDQCIFPWRQPHLNVVFIV